MPELWKPQTIEIYKSWCDSLVMESQDELTQWETDFLASIMMRLDSGRNLSESQANTLEKIYTEKTS